MTVFWISVSMLLYFFVGYLGARMLLLDYSMKKYYSSTDKHYGEAWLHVLTGPLGFFMGVIIGGGSVYKKYIGSSQSFDKFNARLFGG